MPDLNEPADGGYVACGAKFEWQQAGYKKAVEPCSKPDGHENGPDTDWKREWHSNGMFKWPVHLTEVRIP